MTLRQLGIALLATLLLVRANAHELQANRLTLVMREPNHLSMTFYLDYLAVMNQSLAPKLTPGDFVVRYAAMPTVILQKELTALQDRLQRETSLQQAKTNTALRIEHWVWPSVAKVQTMLQQRAMQMMVAPNDHPSDATVEVLADAIATQPIKSILPKLPASFQPMLIVSYRPQQTWVTPDKSPTWVPFP